MSDTQHSEDNHEGPIKTPKQLVLTVIASFVVPIIVIIMLASFVSFGAKEGAGSDLMDAAAVAKRLAPVGSVEVRDANAPVVLKTGQQVFEAVCTTCHTPGAVGAPKFGDAAAWAPRIKTGYEALVHSALHGKGNMPAQGGGDLADVEVERAVVYMADKAGASFPEPALPAAASASAAASGAAASEAPASAASAAN